MFSYGHLQSRTRPIPQTSIQVHNPLNNSQNSNAEAEAIVDTGAVMTCIPESIIRQLGSSLLYSTISIKDVNGNLQPRTTCWIDIIIDDYEYENLEVIAIPKQFAIIGRDILNTHVVVLNALRGWGFICNNPNCSVTQACSRDQ